MNEKGNRYALAALKNKRATLASEIVHLESQLRHRKGLLVHVDMTLKLLDPSIEVGAIPNKRLSKRVKLFGQGQLGRFILGAFREAKGPLSCPEIVSHVLREGGHGEEARPAVRGRVRGNLSYLERRGKVIHSGSGRAARWRLSG